MRHHPSACRLARVLVKSHFGGFCQVVCTALIDRGPQSLRELVLAAEFEHLREATLKERRRQTDKIVRLSLQILLQHSYIVTYRVFPDITRKNQSPEGHQIYCIDLTAIIRSLRLPTCIQMISDWYSKPGEPQAGAVQEAIVTVLLENGRLSLEQIVLAVVDKLVLPQGSEQAVKEAFKALVSERFVEQAVPSYLPTPTARAFARLTGRKPATPKPGSEAQSRIDAELARQQPAVDYRDNRFTLASELEIQGEGPAKREAEEQLSTPPAKRQKISKAAAKAAQRSLSAAKQKPPVTEVKAEAISSPTGHVPDTPNQTDDDPVLWQICHLTLVRRARYQACAEHLRKKVGETGGLLARCIARASKASMSSEPRSEQISMAATEQQIATLLPLCASGSDASEISDLSEALQDLVEENPSLVQTSQTQGFPSYYLHLGNIITEAKMVQLQSLLKRRFGIEGLRIWNCLLEHKQMESKTISERVLMPSQQTVSILYKLLRGGFVAIQDIPRTADHAPSKTIYTWKIDLEAIYEQVAANMMKSMCNLADRLDAELSKRPQLLEAMHRRDEAAIMSFGKEAQKVKMIADQLECHSLTLAPDLALFLEF